MMACNAVDEHISEIGSLCREFGVVRLDAVSFADASESGEPELFFIVTLPSGYDFGPGGSSFSDLETRLASLLGRDITLLTPAVLRNDWIRGRVWATRSILYEAPARYPYAS